MTQKKWIITGAAGFIGYRFYQAVKAKGIPVLLVDHLGHFQSRTAEHPLPDASLLMDRAEFIKKIGSMNPAEIGAIIHMGACSATTELRVDFLREVNVEYSQTIWNYCSKHKIPFVYASSAATYGAGENGYADDESLTSELKPLNPYG
ncbi:MAG: NAD-dependent epimerase/dehydratase family protein, partial [Proteobacteria bacterium]